MVIFWPATHAARLKLGVLVSDWLPRGYGAGSERWPLVEGSLWPAGLGEALARAPKGTDLPMLRYVTRVAEIDEVELAAFLHGRLLPYKRPERLLFVAALPKSPLGKIARQALAKP